MNAKTLSIATLLTWFLVCSVFASVSVSKLSAAIQLFFHVVAEEWTITYPNWENYPNMTFLSVAGNN